MKLRQHGISTLIACQNEEATIGLCLASFLSFSDEIIVVDNGSTDESKDICRDFAAEYPDKIRFYDVPHLRDLYENRQYALERSRFQWIVRGDADYVCYTSGDLDCLKLREEILATPSISRPRIYSLFEPTLYGDFWHTALPDAAERPADIRAGCGTWRRMPVVSKPNPRIYRWLPGMSFSRLGRVEGVYIPRLLRRLFKRINWPQPIWMECNVKSEENMLFRSERTNWREMGDFRRYPDLKTYLQDQLQAAYGTDSIEEAKAIYCRKQFLPFLAPYVPSQFYPLPDLVQWAQEHHPVYRIHLQDDPPRRDYFGVNRESLRNLMHGTGLAIA